MSGNNAAPTIIKRKKVVVVGGHHGGAWKVAYADFVTAMMAFFMLMWLIGATTEEQRKGIADYFSVSVPLTPTSGGGKDAFSGDSVFEADVLPRHGRGAAIDVTDTTRGTPGAGGRDSVAEEEAASAAALEAIEALLSGSGGESMVSDLLLHHVVTRQTDEGLVIELHDLPGAPLFAGHGGEPTPLLMQLATELAPVLDIVTNPIAAGGHVAGRPVVEIGADPWTRSTERAQSIRRLLSHAGTSPERFVRVTGHGDRKPVTVNGLAPRNARVEVILLRRLD